MLDTARAILAVALLGAGIFFFLTGAIGVVRFPDVYNRLHAATKAAVSGGISILLSGIVGLEYGSVTIKAVAILLFLAITYPVAGHLLARAAYLTGVPLTDRTMHDELQHIVELESEGTQGNV